MEANFILSLVVISIMAVIIRFLFGRNRRSDKDTKMPGDHAYKIY